MASTVRFFLIIFLSMATRLAMGQQYVGEARIFSVEANGYYRVVINPGLMQYLTAGFANLRISDSHDNIVPYIIDTAYGSYASKFDEYEIKLNTQTPGCCTKIVFANSSGDTINNIHIKVKNADLDKWARLEGSDDEVNWFGVKGWFYLDKFMNPSQPSELRIVDFPLVNYRYFRITINDSTSAPLNIESVGYYRDFYASGKYHRLTDVKSDIDNRSDEKKTVIRLKLDSLQWIDKIELNAGGTPLFRRDGMIYSITTRRGKKGRVYEERVNVGSFIVAHDHRTVVSLREVRASELMIEIENADSPPLKFEPPALYQLERSALVYLEAGNQYAFRIGSQQMSAPVYDLALLRDQIKGPRPILEHDSVVLYEHDKTSVSDTFFSSGYMWAGIVGVIILLGFLSIRMIREM